MAKDTIEAIREAELRAADITKQAHEQAARIIEQAKDQAQQIHNDNLASAKAAAADTLHASRENGEELIRDQEALDEELCSKIRSSVAGKLDDAVNAVIARLI